MTSNRRRNGSWTRLKVDTPRLLLRRLCTYVLNHGMSDMPGTLTCEAILEWMTAEAGWSLSRQDGVVLAATHPNWPHRPIDDVRERSANALLSALVARHDVAREELLEAIEAREERRYGEPAERPSLEERTVCK